MSTGHSPQAVPKVVGCFSALLILSISGVSQPPKRIVDCSALRYKQHRVAWLCGKAIVCSGDICGRPSTYEFDDAFIVALRDKQGKELETLSLSYERSAFCFNARKHTCIWAKNDGFCANFGGVAAAIACRLVSRQTVAV